MENIKLENFVSMDQTIATELFLDNDYVWDAIRKIKEVVSKNIEKILKNASLKDEYIIKEDKNGEKILIHKDANVLESAYILGPTIIQKNAEVRHCAFIRGNVIIGENCVIGNSCELKSAIVFNNAQIPHFNYVGDSIIGSHAHLGAQSLTSNFKSDKTNVSFSIIENGIVKKFETGLRKFGAIVGDDVEIGCGTILNPGTIIGKNTRIYPLQSIRGYIRENRIVKSIDNQVELKK